MYVKLNCIYYKTFICIDNIFIFFFIYDIMYILFKRILIIKGKHLVMKRSAIIYNPQYALLLIRDNRSIY
jgi:hypothetical protein